MFSSLLLIITVHLRTRVYSEEPTENLIAYLADLKVKLIETATRAYKRSR
jgi:hypothetical protein